MSENQEQWRAQHYALLATLLAAPPQTALLANVAEVEITEPDSPMGQAWQTLKAASEQTDDSTLSEEYHALFIGMTQGEVIPYGSFYQTGFLNEKPLALLRKDLAQLGLERQDDKKEPEDHIAAEFDVMRLILSAQGTPLVDAPTFFNRHISPWAKTFFSDLEAADNAVFYRSVAGFASQFLKLEAQLMK